MKQQKLNNYLVVELTSGIRKDLSFYLWQENKKIYIRMFQNSKSEISATGYHRVLCCLQDGEQNSSTVQMQRIGLDGTDCTYIGRKKIYDRY